LQLQEAQEGILQPAARKYVIASLEQSSGDILKLNQSMSLARTLDLGDVVEDTLKPWLRRQAVALQEHPNDMTRLTQLHSAAQMLNLRDVIEENIKPAFRKMVQSAVDQPLNAATAPQILNLARNMGVKEAAPLAVKMALAREVQSYTRGTAIFFVAEFGGKEELAKLEPLLDDTTSVGSSSFNWTTVNAEIRDVVLGVFVFTSGQSLADYGFPYYQMFPAVRLTTTWPASMGFPSAAAREAAMKKWKEWSVAQKK
jgi:hypothetical protein